MAYEQHKTNQFSVAEYTLMEERAKEIVDKVPFDESLMGYGSPEEQEKARLLFARNAIDSMWQTLRTANREGHLERWLTMDTGKLSELERATLPIVENLEGIPRDRRLV